MAGPNFLSCEELSEFHHRGVLRLPGLLSAGRVRRAREYVEGRLALLGLWRDGAWRLDDHPRPQWPNSGVTSSKAIGNRHPDLEALIDEPALIAAVDELLEGRAIDRDLFKRPQILFSLPNADSWAVPTSWHVDSPRLAGGRLPGVQLFTFLDLVERGGGGTLVVAGSHRLFSEGRFILAKELASLLRRYDYFRDLCCEAPDEAEDRARLLSHTGTVGDVALQIVELTGSAGDAYLVDLRVLHTAAPNAANRPRLMATHRFWCADAIPELGQAYGWK